MLNQAMSDRAVERIVLVYPNAGQDVLGINVGLPLSILYVGTALKEAGYQVTILDQRVQTNFDALLADAVRSKPVFVGISSMTGYQIGYGLSIARAVREYDSQVPIVWGGVHPTSILIPLCATPLWTWSSSTRGRDGSGAGPGDGFQERS